MLFNSIDFLIFLPIVFLLYWFVLNKNLKIQNLLLLIASYVFYAWWDYRFLSLIALSTLVDFFIGIKIHETEHIKKRKWWLWFSMSFNLGLLGFFKYFNFFIDSWVDAFNTFGYKMDYYSLQIILPVGISFYTFQTMSYSLDISKRNLEPTKDFVAFATFVSFFPQLVAGPIERASNLLPQFFSKRKFNYAMAVDGSRQMLWGLFKKIVIADNCAPFVNDVFQNYSIQSSGTLILGVIIFAFQIYADFSGYTDIAIGTAKLFGFEFKRNFNYPYFATNISDFWKRWHISLSSWLNDYVFTPLAINFRDYKKRGVFAAVFVTFLLSGLWHGAGWNYIVWGGLHGLFYIPIIFSKKRFTAISTNKGIKKNTSTLKDLHKMVITFILVCFTYIFFRAENLNHAIRFLKTIYFGILNGNLFNIAKPNIIVLLLIPILIWFEWLQREHEHGLYLTHIKQPIIRGGIYLSIFISILFFGASSSPFIYFQF
ncbi:MBOAT family protein [Cellulophaga sp. Hel_I_12]|uniref:MBOAT family O-acyltransferase n=1 Tax=Cellulophaga sp. Hel_I_12 TaxID=1249972 RepID=UPI000646EF3B|nr:MBOAT family O-acyltransferase [Cellulophaga sp. Hel_I_12]